MFHKLSFSHILSLHNLLVKQALSTSNFDNPSTIFVKTGLGNLHQLYSLNYTDESLYKLFLINQFMNHNDIISVIGPMLNVVE